MPSAPVVLVGDEVVIALRALMESGVPGRPVPVRRACPICRTFDLSAASQFMGFDEPQEPTRRFRVIVRCNSCERRFETGRTYQLNA